MPDSRGPRHVPTQFEWFYTSKTGAKPFFCRPKLVWPNFSEAGSIVVDLVGAQSSSQTLEYCVQARQPVVCPFYIVVVLPRKRFQLSPGDAGGIGWKLGMGKVLQAVNFS